MAGSLRASGPSEDGVVRTEMGFMSGCNEMPGDEEMWSDFKIVVQMLSWTMMRV